MQVHKKSKFSFFVIVMVLFICVSNFTIISKAQEAEKITKEKIVGEWKNGGTESWETDGFLIKKNGKIEFRAWRIEDRGTYKISKNKKKIFATFDDNYYNQPATDEYPQGGLYQREGKYRLTIILKSDKKWLLSVVKVWSIMRVGKSIISS